MINLVRGEVYKLFRSKCFYVCCIATAVFVLFMYGMFFYTDMALKQRTTDIIEVTVESASEDVTVWEEMDVLTIAKTMFTTFGKIIVAIFTAIFVFGEYVNGAIKNVVGKGYNRGVVFAAKYVSTTVGAVFIDIVMGISIFMCEILILRAERLTAELLVNLCSYIGMQLFLGAILTGIMVVINQICRNLGAGIAISVCMIMFSTFVTTGLNAFLAYLKINVNVCKYWILDLIADCPMTDMDRNFLIRAIVCSVVWFAVALGIGTIHFRKADVK